MTHCITFACLGVKSDEDYAKRIEIDSRLEEYTIGNLNPSEDYYVWMYSVAPDGGESKSTKPLRETVHRSGEMIVYVIYPYYKIYEYKLWVP